MYEIGKVYIWQNLAKGAHLNGTECTVVGPVKKLLCPVNNEIWMGQETDTVDPRDGKIVYAEAGKLRPKNPPTGEQKIRSMFEPKPVMEVA